MPNNSEILLLVNQHEAIFAVEAWHGKSVKAILDEVDDSLVFQKPSGQHSILELVWHMGTWKEFTLDRLQKTGKDVQRFDDLDWRELDHNNKALWPEGLGYFWKTHHQYMALLEQQYDTLLEMKVEGRNHNYRYLLNGSREHDVYHSAQIIYIHKLLKG